MPENDYGYKHPPRAARDARELNIELRTVRVKSTDGRNIAAYELVSIEGLINRSGGKEGGRRTLPKLFKAQLIAAFGNHCNVCSGLFPPSLLQIDHKVPYEVGGEIEGELNVRDFQLVCGSCNRAKSWTCEHCPNWTTTKDKTLCLTCYWGSPEKYSHIALQQMRRVDVTWSGAETDEYEALARLATKARVRVPEYVKRTLSNSLKKLG